MSDRERGPESDPESDGSAPTSRVARERNMRHIDRLLGDVEPPSDPELAAECEAHNRQLYRRYPTEILDEGRLEAVEEIFHEDIQTRSREGEILEGRDELREYLAVVRSSFEDLETEVVSVLASPTEVMGWFWVRAVHEADYFGVDPSGRPVRFPVATYALVKDGRIVWYGDWVNPLQMQPPARRHGRHEVLDQLQEGVVVVDRGQHIVEINPAAASMLGVDDQDVLDEPVGSVLEGVDLPEPGSSVEVTFDEKGRIVDVSASALTDLKDERIGRILTLQDVTDRVRRRQQLETLNRQNDRLDEFVSVVSHDLRNPLKKAGGYLDLARETGEAEYFEKIEQSHARVEQIVDELLTMARSGVTVDETEHVSLSHLLEDAWTTASTPDATLETALPAGACVAADPNLLQHVLENLFRNAADHNDGSITIRVGALSDRHGFYIEDDGEGIPPDEREDVFEHGYSTAADGSGFGLSIVEQFVTAHGWSVEIAESAEGGARFEIVTGTPLDEV